MCGCSPVCKSFFDTHRAAGSFVHVSGLSMRRIFVAGRYGVLDSGSRSAPRTHRSAVGIWFSRSRPYDRLLHKSSENSPLSASGRTPSANSVPGSASGMDDQLPLVSLLLLSATPQRAAPVDSSPSIGRASSPFNPFRTSPDPSRNEPRRLGPSPEGGEQPLHQSRHVRIGHMAKAGTSKHPLAMSFRK